MGFDEGQLVLNSDNGTYYPGQMLYGRLEFDLNKDKKFRGIYAEIKGKCKVHWVTNHTRRVNDRTEHYSITHESYEEYMNTTVYLIGSKSGEETLHPGRHVFPFECQIPPHCPSSFEGSDGSIRYTVKVTVDRAFKLDQTKQASFRVEAPLDLNTLAGAKEPIAFEFEQTFCCWCMNAGLSETVVKLPASGFVPRQVMPIEVACNNNSTIEIDTLRFTLKKTITFEAHTNPDTRRHEDVIAEIKKGPVPGNTIRKYTVDMEVPDMDVPNLNTCRFINIDYDFKVELETSGCHEDESESRRIFIGTIPIASLQYPPNSNFATANDVPAFNPYPAPPVVNQPLSNSAYPGANPPYPGNTPNVGFTTENPPYPTVSPYPAASPYPIGGNPPYPSGANPPYPANNLVTTQLVNSAPYPDSGKTSPYPPNVGQTGLTSPYPASPNIGANPPYPTTNAGSQLNIGSNPPYPTTNAGSQLNIGSNPPYPTTNAGSQLNIGSNPPYPTTNAGSQLNIGSNPPYPTTNAGSQLNMGSNPPYPTTNAGSQLNIGSNSPYPTRSPYSSNTPIGSGLKTGTLGFTSGPKESMPLLPPGGMPQPASPFASASAPPSTPDDENQKLAQNGPPYPL